MHPNGLKKARHDAAAQPQPALARIGPDGASWLTRPHGGRGEAVLVPGEHVRLLAVDLPMRDARARVRALPYAAEPLMGQPPDAFHAALGRRLEGSRFLAAAVSRTLMQDWIAMLDEAGAPHAALIPEPFALAVPAQGTWTIRREAGRVIARRPDGAGFSAPATIFGLIHEAAGKPQLDEAAEGRWPALTADPPLDLRQGTYAARRAAMPPGLRAAALILTAGAGLHAAIALADLAALSTVADAREAQAARLLDQAGIEPGPDPAAAILASLPSGGPARSGLFAMLDTMAGALAGQDNLAVRALRYRDAASELSLDLQADDLSGLQAAESALARAGLAASSGSASARDGMAEATLTLTPGSAP